MATRDAILFSILFFIASIHGKHLHRNTRPKRALCSTLLECTAMGISIISPRYITNLVGLHDRAVDYNSEFHETRENDVEHALKSIEHMKETEKYNSEIHNLTMAIKARRIEMLKNRTLEILQDLELDV